MSKNCRVLWDDLVSPDIAPPALGAVTGGGHRGADALDHHTAELLIGCGATSTPQTRERYAVLKAKRAGDGTASSAIEAAKGR